MKVKIRSLRHRMQRLAAPIRIPRHLRKG
jgi:hypothetical protein